MFWQAPVAVDAHSRASCTLARRALFRSPTAASLGPWGRERSSDGVDSGPAVAAAAGAAGPGATTRSCASVVALLRPVTAPEVAFHAEPIIIPRYPSTWVPKYASPPAVMLQLQGTRGRRESFVGARRIMYIDWLADSR